MNDGHPARRAHRFANSPTVCHSLTYEEEMLWKLIQEDPTFWLTASSDGVSKFTFNFKALREHWDKTQDSRLLGRAAKGTSYPDIGGFPFRGGRVESSIPSGVVPNLRRPKIPRLRRAEASAEA